jgi:hypothetical protein
MFASPFSMLFNFRQGPRVDHEHFIIHGQLSAPAK